MYAPKPAICGNGHAAMQRTHAVVIHSMTDEKSTQKKPVQKVQIEQKEKNKR